MNLPSIQYSWRYLPKKFQTRTNTSTNSKDQSASQDQPSLPAFTQVLVQIASTSMFTLHTQEQLHFDTNLSLVTICLNISNKSRSTSLLPKTIFLFNKEIVQTMSPLQV